MYADNSLQWHCIHHDAVGAVFFFFSSVMAAKENKTLRDVLTNLLTQ